MNIKILCKVCRQVERGRPQITLFIDESLRANRSLRKISKEVYLKFGIYISHVSISLHKHHYESPKVEAELPYHSAFGYAKSRY